MEKLAFAEPRWLIVLLPAFLLSPLVIWFLGSRRRARGDSSVLFSSLRLLERYRGSWGARLHQAVRVLRHVVLFLLLLAILRPQTAKRFTEVQTEGIEIVLVLDTSGSMRGLDLDTQERSIRRRRDRLEVSKAVVTQFVAARPTDQIGLVVFGEEAFTQCPLTLDHQVLTSFVDRLEIGMAGDATAIGSALGVAVKRLKEAPGKSKVIVLLTDGRSNAGTISPLTAAEIAQTFGIKVYIIGAGAKGRAPFVVDTRLGPQVVYEDVEIDEKTLRRIADLTGGSYFRAEDVESLAKIYEDIDRLEKTEITTQSFLEYDERFRWFALPALAILLLEILLANTRARRLP